MPRTLEVAALAREAAVSWLSGGRKCALLLLVAESGATRTPIPAQGGQHSGNCGQQVMAA
jgi:hypothetical protein